MSIAKAFLSPSRARGCLLTKTIPLPDTLDQAGVNTMVRLKGLDLRCGEGRLGLQSAPGALPGALGFESHGKKRIPPHGGIIPGAPEGTRTHTHFCTRT